MDADLGYKIPVGEVVGGGAGEGLGSRLVGLHLKGAHPAHWFTVSRNLLTLREAVPPKSASPQMSKRQIKKIKDMVSARPLGASVLLW